MTRSPGSGAVHFDGHALACEVVHDVQGTEATPVRQRVGGKVHRPPLQSLARCRQWHPLCAGQPLSSPTSHLQAGGAINAMDPFMVHREAFACEQDVEPSVAEARPRRGVRLEPRQHGQVHGVRTSLIAPRGRTQTRHPTGPTQAGAARLQPPHRLAPSDGAYHFFATTALSA